MPATRLIGFYSFKGGVGRSLALAHCAVELVRAGRKVLIIDLDLEAPGQHCTSLFQDQYSTSNPTTCDGFLGFVDGYARRMADGLPLLEQHYLLSRVELGKSEGTEIGAGQLFLMPSGPLAKDGEYRQALDGFNWDNSLQQGADFGLLRHLKDECVRLGFDDVLLDSRTGDSDPFYVVALELAEVFVVVTGFNRQNLLGTQSQLDHLQSFAAERRPRKVLLVYSPRPPVDDLGYWRTHIQPLAPRLKDPEDAVTLPYQTMLALSEEVLNQAPDSDGEYLKSIRRLVDSINLPDGVATSPPVVPTLVNPFSVIRADYASNKELIKFFVDPGDAVTRALSDFMPLMIYGNRGTGKTTLAKHHSYETALDRLEGKPRQQDLPDLVGLYVRLDIDLLNAFNVRDDQLRAEFNRLFANFFDILVSRKALAALHAFGGIPVWCDERKLFAKLLREFGEFERAESELTFETFQDFVELHFSKIRQFLNNPASAPVPIKIQGNILMKLLVEALLDDPRHAFGERSFAMMVDEVEHFETYQQAVLNSRIKQIKRSDRVTYRYFLRHEGLRTRSTVVAADQTIQESHDFRTLNLDGGLNAEIFERHVGEIAARQLAMSPQIGPIQLASGQRTLADLFATLEPEQEAQRLLGSRSHRVVKDKLRDWLLKHHDKRLTPRFMTWFDGEPAVLRRVVAVILLNQPERNFKSPDQIAECFEQWDQRARDWYHNYHRAGLHWLCRLYKTDKVYAGLDQLYLLAGQNVRYFLEYCRAIVDEWIASAPAMGGDKPMVLPIPVEVQDRAIRARAQFYIDDLRGKPRHAEQMLNLVKRLGAIFSAAHASPKQSQFEINHFSIVDYDQANQPELEKYLRECRMENVLFRRPGNKTKSLSDDRLDDWVLHPSFAPYFNISPRRKKKLETLRAGDISVLFNGTAQQFKALLTRTEKSYASIDMEDLQAEAEGEVNHGEQAGLDFDADTNQSTS